MKVIRFLAVPLVFLALVLGVQNQNPHFAAPTVQAEASDDRDRVLVKFKDGVPASEKAAAHRQAGSSPVEVIKGIDVDVVALPQGKGKGAVTVYNRNPRVQYAEADALVLPEEVPDDPYYSAGWHLPKIDAPGAWDLARATGVLIAICDTGIQADHPDLAPVLRADLGYNSADGSTNWSPVHDHGTSVAGAVAAATDNTIGVSGVAWGAQVIPVRITNRTDGAASFSAAAQCITYAADQGARAINVSYLMAGSSTIDSAGQYARGKGAITTVAAGNYSEDPGWPNHPGFLAVSATNGLDNLASFSNFGSFVDIAAPGVSIWTTTTRDGGSYRQMGGTSAASPVAAGVIALIFGSNPGISASQAQDILLASVDDLGDPGWDPNFGHGRVNAHKAVAAAMGSGTGTGAISGKVTDAADGTPISGATVFDGTRTASSNSSGDYSLTGAPEGTYSVTASVAGYSNGSQTVSVLAGNSSTADFALTAEPPAPSPVVTVTSINPDAMKRGTSTQMTIAGSGFVPGASVSFGKGDGPSPSASNVVIVDSSTITATISAKSGGPPRSSQWELRITNPDGTSGSLNGLTVVP